MAFRVIQTHPIDIGQNRRHDQHQPDPSEKQQHGPVNQKNMRRRTRIDHSQTRGAESAGGLKHGLRHRVISRKNERHGRHKYNDDPGSQHHDHLLIFFQPSGLSAPQDKAH